MSGLEHRELGRGSKQVYRGMISALMNNWIAKGCHPPCTVASGLLLLRPTQQSAPSAACPPTVRFAIPSRVWPTTTIPRIRFPSSAISRVPVICGEDSYQQRYSNVLVVCGRGAGHPGAVAQRPWTTAGACVEVCEELTPSKQIFSDCRLLLGWPGPEKVSLFLFHFMNFFFG